MVQCMPVRLARCLTMVGLRASCRRWPQPCRTPPPCRLGPGLGFAGGGDLTWCGTHRRQRMRDPGVFQGQSDVPAEPIEDPARHAIPAAGPRTIYTSPLQRALTAAEVLFPGENAIVDDRLMERSVGEWEGLDHATVRRRWPAYGDETTDLMLTPPGGESLDHFPQLGVKPSCTTWQA